MKIKNVVEKLFSNAYSDGYVELEKTQTAKRDLEHCLNLIFGGEGKLLDELSDNINDLNATHEYQGFLRGFIAGVKLDYY